MTIGLDAYGSAAISLAWNDPVTKIPFTNRLTTQVPKVTHLHMKLLGNNCHLHFKRAVLALVVLLFKVCLACSALSGNSFLATSSA